MLVGQQSRTLGAMALAPSAFARAQRLQVANHAPLCRPEDPYILNGLSQRQAALKSGDQKSRCFLWTNVATHQSAVLPFAQSRGHSVVPFVEDSGQPLPESFVERRHLLSQIIQWTAASQLVLLG